MTDPRQTHLSEFSIRKSLSLHSLDDTTSPSRSSPKNHPLAIPVPPPANIADAATEHTPLLDRKPSVSRPATPLSYNVSPSVRRSQLLFSISYASVSGILSGMCLIFAKSGVELLLLSIGGNNQFWRWEAWVLLLGLLVFALLQLWYLHKSLVYADPTIACPRMSFLFVRFFGSLNNNIILQLRFASTIYRPSSTV